jgi:hypothetical protein
MSVISSFLQLVAVFYLPEYTFPTGCVGSKIQGVPFSIRLNYIVMDCVTSQSKRASDVNRILTYLLTYSMEQSPS